MHEHSGIQPIHLFSCHPLILLITHRETGDSDYLHTLQALRLMATISCPSILTYTTLCFPSTLLAGSRFISFRILSNFFRVTVGTQASDFSTSYLQRKAFPYQGTPNFVKHVFKFFIQFSLSFEVFLVKNHNTNYIIPAYYSIEDIMYGYN